MDLNDEQFDLTFSLGGSCIAALQLRRRELRTCSLPFDWLFHIDETLLVSLNKCFQEDFANWLNRENMTELVGAERGTSPHYQYKDNYTGYRFIHDFYRPIEDGEEFIKVRKRYAKRIKRLYDLIGKTNSCLLLLNTKWNTRPELFELLLATLKNKWPDKVFRLLVVAFSQELDEKVALGEDCLLYKYRRDENAYDYFQTNIEWEFLDTIKIKKTELHRNRQIVIKKVHHGLHLHIFARVRKIIEFRICISSYELVVGIGNGTI